MTDTGKWRLRSARIDSFGSVFGKEVGPFGPGMNVVFGPNESGKTTLASFIGGVLFGWPDARSRRNAYKPENAERSGSLVFTDDNGTFKQLHRGRNADGLQGSSELVSDLDPDTFRTMFSLNSDELLHLGNASDMTAKLLTAGSGTAVSPSAALAELDDTIASYTSRAASAEHSIVNLQRRVEDLKETVAQCQANLDRCRNEHLELQELEPKLAQLAHAHTTLTKRLDKLNAIRGALASEAGEEDSLMESKRQLLKEASSVGKRREAVETAFEDSNRIEILSAAKERAVRDNLEDLEVEQERLEHALVAAKRDLANSSSECEVLKEADDQSAADGRGRNRRTMQVATSTLFPIVALFVGAFLVVQGKETGSLSILAMGLSMILLAFLLAAAVMVITLRPNKTAKMYAQRLENAQWVRNQDQKKVEACELELTQHHEKVANYLRSNGLGAAGSSIRRARSLLDGMREARQAADIYEERRQGLVSQIADANRKMDELASQRSALLEEAGCQSVEDLNDQIANISAQRDDALHQLQVCQNRAGELSSSLASSLKDTEFQKAKLELEETRARLSRSKYEYARLLLARKRLSQAIELWEEQSQPEVYRLAGQLMSRMTDGKWVQVRLTPDGTVRVVDGSGFEQDPGLLSTGTCQQLYLSLRMALLMVAKGVGKSVPILADDILVNFDDERRVGTAKALLELASQRQIIFLTCHQEVAELLRKLDGSVNVLKL